MGDINNKVRKAVCSIISVIMAACIALSVSAIVASGVLKTQEFVAERLAKCQDILLDELVKADEEIMSKQSIFPVKVYTDAVGEPHIKTALLRTSGNLVFGYKTDFSDSTYLYSYYKTSIVNYCNQNQIVIDPQMEDMIARDSALAVDVFNQVCGDESTNFIIPFLMAQSSKPIKVTFVCCLIFILCMLIVKRLNYGDYFRHSYTAMAIIIAGFVMIVLPLFALAMNYPALFDFTDVQAYNLGIQYCIEDTLKILAGTGGVLLIIGIVTMNVVFNRFRNIVLNVQTEMDIAEKLRREYMEEQMKFEMEQGIIDNNDIDTHNYSDDLKHDLDDGLFDFKFKDNKK